MKADLGIGLRSWFASASDTSFIWMRLTMGRKSIGWFVIGVAKWNRFKEGE